MHMDVTSDVTSIFKLDLKSLCSRRLVVDFVGIAIAL